MSLTRIGGKAACDGLSGCRVVEAVEDAALALSQLHGMNHAAQRRRFFDQWTDSEGAKNALGGETFLGDRRVVGNRLTIEALHEVVSRQRDLEQVDERFDPLR